MNRVSSAYLTGGRNMTTDSQARLHRERDMSMVGAMREGEDVLDLFSKIRHTSPRVEPNCNLPTTPERIGPRTIARSRMDELLSADAGKHDYDWLLTPPGTPLVSASETTDHHSLKVSSRNISNIRSGSLAKVSRFSVPQSESINSTRPTRSNSTTRSSLSSSYSSFPNISNSRTSALNTSTSSITSRPSTPGSRTSSVSNARTASALPSRSVPSRSSTPTRTRQPLSSQIDRTKPLQSSRPSTPTGRPQTPSANLSQSLNGSLPRSNSRPSTPTRRTAITAPAPCTVRSSSTSRASVAANRPAGPASRPSSPASRTRAPIQPIVIPDFPMDIPPNLRTTLPERALSASRQRPGMALTALVNPNAAASTPTAPVNSNGRRSSSPVIVRGRLQENSSLSRQNSNSREAKPVEKKKPISSEAAIRRPLKPASPTESNGFGRTISKKSIDMTLKHIDIQPSIGSIRGASFFPPSIRTSAAKGRSGRYADPAAGKFAPSTDESGVSDITSENDNCSVTTPGGCNGSDSMNGSIASKTHQEYLMARLKDLDIHSRCDAMLQREDSRNMNWLHSAEDKPNHSPRMFDDQFDQLPEPFVLP